MTTTTNSAVTTCPSWCIPVGEECEGDHWARPGDAAWPGVTATAWTPYVFDVAPTWGECDGLAPAVLIHVYEQEHPTDRAFSIDLKPDEARALIERLRAALTAVEATR